jgi:hypothetical protein
MMKLADRNRLYVGGHSAGRHLASLRSLNLPQDIIKGCFPVSAVFELSVILDMAESFLESLDDVVHVILL